MLCRFEDRPSGRALSLEGYRGRIEARSPDELDEAFAAIEQARQQGHWLALLLDYELGAWLEPAFGEGAAPAPHAATQARPPAHAFAPDARWHSDDAGPAQSGGRSGPTPRLTALVYERAEETAIWAPPPADAPFDLAARALMKRGDYLRAIETLRQAIARGELYQANYTFPIAVETAMASCDLYRSLAACHPAPHSAYIEDGARSILSFSPELFFERKGDTLTVRPMKGTAPRHADPERDRLAAQALQHSEKDRAENLMIVDLLRNDLGRLATPGSVQVQALFSLERYPSVWTLTSTVTAQAPQASLESLLRALFPCGSITGAPKIAAMNKIRSLEIAPRGIYCGSLGWLAPNGDCSLNVAIRTIAMHAPGRGLLGVGGGIVHDSNAALEWEECLWKARVLGRGPQAPTAVAYDE